MKTEKIIVGKNTKYPLKGILTFILPKWENELTFLYTAKEFTGTITNCNEGELVWVDTDKVLELNLWEGDKHFLPKLLTSTDIFTMKLIYDHNDQLLSIE